MRDPDPLPPASHYLEHAAARRIVIGVLLTMVLAALDQVMVATALPTIAADLGDVDSMPWVVTANLLSGTAVTPLYGKLSDIYGRRRMILIATGIYAVGSVACALAPSMLMLIFARALQGAGGGGLMPLVQTIIGDVASPRDRARYQAFTSSTFIVSTVGGPVLGGVIAEHLHWSWIFWSNLPLCALAFLLTHNVLRQLPRHDRPHRLDLFGALLMVGAAMVLMLALSWGGRRLPWLSATIGTMLAASAALWMLFAWRMIRAEEPFIPLSVLRDGAMRVGTMVSFFAVGVVVALTIILPLYAQLALGLSVTGSASAIIALQGAATMTSMIGGHLLVRFARYKRVPMAGLLLSIAALIPLALDPAGFSSAGALGLIAVVGLGLGPTFPFTVVVVQNAVPLHQLGIATGTLNFFRALGSTFILAGFGALVLAGAPAIRGMPTAAGVATPGAGEAFRWVFAAAILCLLIALGCMVALRERPLRGAVRT
ncbi:MAG: MFS transporter [Hyphomicrobiales bacterium]|nr:MFS transporter [Hyphomicrobiales bacterium]